MQNMLKKETPVHVEDLMLGFILRYRPSPLSRGEEGEIFVQAF